MGLMARAMTCLARGLVQIHTCHAFFCPELDREDSLKRPCFYPSVRRMLYPVVSRLRTSKVCTITRHSRLGACQLDFIRRDLARLRFALFYVQSLVRLVIPFES